MFCSNCGKEIDNDSVFCSYCGYSVGNSNPDSTMAQVSDTVTIGNQVNSTKKKSNPWKIIVPVILLCIIGAIVVFLYNGREQEITLHLSFGDRTGTYKGDMVDGVPNGNGKFTTINEEGDEWIYEGEFVDGHFEGEGKTTWTIDGSMEIGTYSNDVIVPLSGNDMKKLYSDPDAYLDYYAEFVGEVILPPEYEDGVTWLQVHEDIENYDNYIYVGIADENFEVKKGNYIHIVGKIGGTLDIFEGKPFVAALDYEILSHQEAEIMKKSL